jgi:phage recombination protein Bet
MTNEIQIWNEETKLAEIKEMFGKNLTITEFTTFVEMGRALKLNPFMREVWAVKFGSSPAQIFIGRDGYRKNAQRNPEYEYHTVDAVYENDAFEIINGQVVHKYNLKERGRLRGAYCMVKRRNASKEMLTYVEIGEYNTNQNVWKTKPATMIKKVAEAQGLRAAFQEMFQGTYDESEEWEAAQVQRETNVEKLKELLPKSDSSPISKIDVFEPMTLDQDEEITQLMFEKDFPQARIEKAFVYYKTNFGII